MRQLNCAMCNTYLGEIRDGTPEERTNIPVCRMH